MILPQQQIGWKTQIVVLLFWGKCWKYITFIFQVVIGHVIWKCEELRCILLLFIVWNCPGDLIFIEDWIVFEEGSIYLWRIYWHHFPDWTDAILTFFWITGDQIEVGRTAQCAHWIFTENWNTGRWNRYNWKTALIRRSKEGKVKRKKYR